MRQLSLRIASAVLAVSGLGIAPSSGQIAPPCTTCAGDLDGNGQIGLEDLFGILTWYGSSCPVDSNGTTEPAATVYISEIHYNPATSQGSDTDFEFIELHNPASTSAQLWGWTAAGGVTATFQQDAVIAPGGFLVLARNADSLCVNVPVQSPCFEWNAGESLNNTGETIEIRRGDGSISDEVAFEDNDGWVGAPDGGGPSLEWMDPGLDNDDPASWAASFVEGGTPGMPNSMWGLSDPE
jgi:hypothetical protein